MKKNTLLAKIRNSRTVKGILFTVMLSIFFEIISPTAALALTSGPSSPEFSSFEPVASTDMVNDLTGDFTYNLPVVSIPGPDGGGYSMSLSYHSGASPEEEASWVGFGWTLNPGAINRGKRGFADDFKDVPIEKYNKIRPNWTQGSAFDANLEINSTDQAKNEGGIDDLKSNGEAKKSANKGNGKFGFGGVNGFGGGDGGGDDNPWGFKITPSFTNSIRYNNYSGFSASKSFGISAMGLANVNMNLAAGEATFGFSVNPLEILAKYASKLVSTRKKEFEKASTDTKVTLDEFEKLHKKFKNADILNKTVRNFTDFFSVHSYNAPSVPYSVAYASGKAFNFSLSLQINPYGPVGFQFGIKGHLNGQANIPYVNNHKAEGYLYSSEIKNVLNDKFEYADDEIHLGDFQLEKETSFNKHDRYLGIPFNSADVFTVSGASSMGGFSIHHEKIGHFTSNYLKQKQEIRQLGFEVGVGGTIQIGFDIGLGKTVTEIGDWDKFEDLTQEKLFSTPDAAFMQFNSDPGTDLAYSGNTDNMYATISGGLFARKLDMGDLNSTIAPSSLNDGSSKIKYSIFDGSGDLPDNTVLDKDAFSQYISNLDASYANLIGQIAVTNKDGNVSVYGLPVFTKNEYEITVGIEETETEINNISFLKGKGVYLGTSDKVMKNKTVSGQKIETPWASTYLLTQNTTFDYVDADDILGPSEGDFGGWTKFDYRKAFGGGANSWYQYRSPYKKLFYNRGRLLDKKDQTGSMSRGEKEVYYLKAVETKTHVAFFVTNMSTSSDFAAYTDEDITKYVTGSQLIRKDGKGALQISGDMDPDADDTPDNIDNGQSVQKLEKIVLFAKDDFSKPISVTNFEYSYELCQGLPNSEQNGGKLTLKKVWTEGGGTIKSRISPYQFEYNYFRNYSSRITTKYGDIDDVFAGLPATSENPNYVPGELDAWGNYRLNGEERLKKMKSWVDQASNQALDPAAWQLKRIILPSGGEIHVQYEQKDYTYVMNKRAMVMTPLSDDANTTPNDLKDFGYFSKNTGYKINVSHLNSLPGGEREQYRKLLDDYFVTGKEKLYYKFLYSLSGNETPSLTNYNRKTEYVDGYTTVNAVELSGSEIILRLGEDKDNGNDNKDRTLPRWVGYQMACSNGGVSLANQVSFGEDVLTDDDNILDAAYNDGQLTVDETEFKKELRKLSKANCFDFFGEWVAGLDSDQGFRRSKRENFCRVQSFQDSYLKLPIFKKSKKGGGCRVKRILTYDKGIASDSGSEMVYGSEYIYKLENSEYSSGVATNEPTSMREENALVTFLERKPQKKLDKVLNGKDTKQFEGPLGENLLPSASIAYSRVVIKNIHSGNTTTGYAVNEYYTCKEFPMVVDVSNLSKNDNTYRKLNFDLPLGIINIGIHKAWLTQGYTFKLNDMHGKPKTQMTFSGDYDPDDQYKVPTSKTIYNYSTPGENIDVIYLDGNNFVHGNTTKLGNEEDITMYRSRIKEATTNFALEIDLNINLPLFITVGFDFAFDYTLNDLSQHVTTKVISQKSFLKSTTSTVDGVTQTTENIAFDRNTGDPVLTRTYDGFISKDESIYTKNDNTDRHSGYVYALNIPASWVYASLGKQTHASSNSNQLSASVGSVVTYGKNELYQGIKDGLLSIGTNFSNIINANAIVMKNDWFTSGNPFLSTLADEYSIPTSGPIYDQLNSHYYPYRSYTYRSNVTDGLLDQIYGGGYINSAVPLFDWNASPTVYSQSSIGNWFSVSEVLAYTPHGSPIVEKDILEIFSVAKYGSDKSKTLPYLLAQNASYKQVEFKDYELSTSSYSNQAHSGKKSLDLTGAISQPIFANYDFSNLQARGVSLKLWLKSNLSDDPLSPNYSKKNPNPQLKALIGANSYSMKRIAQTGEWSLYVVDINSSVINGEQDIYLSYNFSGNEMVLVDDVRIQPKDALMNCTVYSKDKKVLAQFDDQHFGVFYEYNQEGLLMRHIIETEKGKKVIKEQHQNSPKVNR